jgi:hypothetical protein
MPTANLTATEKTELESLVDHHSVEVVLYALSEICGEKSEHIRHTWQDEALRKRWWKASRSTERWAHIARELGV